MSLQRHTIRKADKSSATCNVRKSRRSRHHQKSKKKAKSPSNTYIRQVSYAPMTGSVNSMQSSQSFMNPKHSDSTMEKMYQYFLKGQLSDVTLVAGDEEIKAHRIVLSSVSGYFSAMFNSDLIESKTETVNLKDINGKALKDLISYAYTGQINLLEDTVETVFCAASLLGFLDIVEACSSFLQRQLDPSNCIGIAVFADLRSCNDLRNAALTFLSNNFLSVIENEEFLMLSHSELSKILVSDDLNVPSETSVFKALMKWINYDKENRKSHMDELLGNVKLPLLSPSFISEEVTPQVGAQGRELVIEALEYHLLPDKRPKISSFRTTPRKSTLEFVFAIAGTAIESADFFRWGTCCESYNPRSNTWRFGGRIPTRRRSLLQHAVASFKNKIFVAGGRDGLKTLNSVDCYNVISKSWTSLQDMSTPRHGLGLATIQPDGPIYAVGGHDGWSYLNTVERWDPETASWTYVEPLSTPRSTVGVAVLNNKVYAIGGRDGVNCLNIVEVYDPHTNKWKQCSPMHQRRGGVALAVLNDQIYAFGGHDISNQTSKRHSSIERYDPKLDTWTLVGEMSSGRDGVGVAVIGNCILTAGGFNGETSLRVVELYNPFTNEWTKLSSMNIGRAGPFMAAIKVEGDESIDYDETKNDDEVFVEERNIYFTDQFLYSSE